MTATRFRNGWWKATLATAAIALILANESPLRAGSFSKNIEINLPRVKKLDPASDCRRAIQHGDLRFVAVVGYALDVVGVPNYYERYWRTHAVKIISGTTDADGDPIWERRATSYAAKYNSVLLDYLNSQSPK